MPIPSTASLQGSILRSVSRSFYLSIRVLPRELRDPIALAYLLARATDTIADSAEIDATLRRQHLAALADVIQSGAPPEATFAIRDSFAPRQTDASERALIERLPQCIEWLRRVEEADRADIRRVLAHINRGQALDVERFGRTGNVVALQTAAELDEYTYLVAGCVGEFWTSVCSRKLPKFADKPANEMRSLGVQYGKALQLINILRDVGSDLRAGRCYLPAEELAAIGLAPGEITTRPDALAPILARWHETAASGLRAGVDYACAIRPWRVRLATALPALIGTRTLALLRAAGPDAVANRIKVNRAEVRRILFTTVASLASPGVIRRAATENTAAASR